MPTEATRAHLRRLYADRSDPWGHHSRPYEQAKFDRTLAAIDDQEVETALEIGCGTGALTARLARRCTQVVAVDCVSDALQQAAWHLRACGNVDLRRGEAPDDLPDCSPNLIVLSEVVYYLEASEITRLADWINAHARRPATILCVNWSGPTGQTLSGAEAVELFASACAIVPETTHHPGYRIDLLRHGPAAC